MTTSKIPRKTQQIFGTNADASDMLQFGSRAANAPVETFDVDTIQALPAWQEGIRNSLVANSSGGLVPVLQDRNAVDYVYAYQLAYLFQNVMAEYDSGTAYTNYSIVRNPNTTELYVSLTDNNTGNALSNGTYWSLLGDLANLGSSTEFVVSLLQNGYIKFPNGLIIQWGTTGSISLGFTVVFPITFPNYCLNVIGCTTENYIFGVSSITTSGFTDETIYYDGSRYLTHTDNYIAIGY
jgi:hypothetical protein